MLPAKMICNGVSIIFLALFSITSLVERGESLAVMSIDLGSEWMKVAIVSPGVPMEIALNKESKRKTPATIAFRAGERTFGEDAKTVSFRSPATTFAYLLDLVGKPIDHPIVQLFSQRFPQYHMIADTERDTIAFTMGDENTIITPEELIAQLLHKGKEFAEISANQRISEVVITVPGFFNQAERRAIMQAAELVDLKVLQLMNDYTAVALNYAISRRKEINDTAHYVIFYDMGAGSTTATVVSYQNVKTKEKGFVETHPHVNILGVGYDRTLGGLEMQIRLRNYLAEQFDAMNKTTQSVFKSPRAMNKLFEEAGQVKNILSANADHYAQIEGLIDEQDFKLQVTRDKLEELCADLFERVANPIQMALETSALTMDLISQVVLVGAGTRMPKVQDTLSEFVKMQLSKNLNTDEAAALGAAYKAADLSQGFKVKKFVTKDAVTFPIQVVFNRIADNNAKKFRRTLFNRMNAYPQKKIITFNKHTENFSFDINYSELDYLPSHEITAIGNLNISTVTLTGVPEALKKHAAEGAESKGIKAHFAMDESGLLNLLGVDLVSEKANVAASEEEGTFSKLGSTISKLFTGSEDKENTEKVDDQKKEDIKPVHEESEYSELNKDTKEETNKKNDTKPSEEPAANKTEKAEKPEKEKKVTTITLKEPITAIEIKLGPKILDEERFQKSYEKIQKLQQHDLEKIRRDTAFHSLESFVIDVQLQLQSEEVKPVITPEEAEQIEKRCVEISNWLYDEGSEESAEVYEKTLKEIQKLTQNLHEKIHEHKERPEALKGLSSMLNRSRTFLNSMKNLSLSSEIFTKVEIDMLEKVINETEELYKTVVKHYEETPLHHPIKYKVRDITAKIDTLDREVKYLVNKAKIWRSKHEAASANQTEKKVEGEKKIVVEESSENSEKTVEEEKIPSESKEEKKDDVKDPNSAPQESEKSKIPSETDDKTIPSAEKQDVHVDL